MSSAKGMSFPSVGAPRPMYSRAFTLVEMIVALGIFSIVAVVALGALVKIISVNQKAQTLHQAMTNLSFSLESISRELRTGAKLHCESGTALNILLWELTDTRECPSGEVSDGTGAVFAFNSTRLKYDAGGIPLCRLIYAYRLRPVDAMDPTLGYVLEKAEQADCGGNVGIGGNDFAPITDPDVIITSYTIKLDDNEYPLVFLKLSGYVGASEKERTYFDLQTAVSPRVPNTN